MIRHVLLHERHLVTIYETFFEIRILKWNNLINNDSIFGASKIAFTSIFTATWKSRKAWKMVAI
jgi:hypothetical protein